jgi:hypothetical protein
MAMEDRVEATFPVQSVRDVPGPYPQKTGTPTPSQYFQALQIIEGRCETPGISRKQLKQNQRDDSSEPTGEVKSALPQCGKPVISHLFQPQKWTARAMPLPSPVPGLS